MKAKDKIHVVLTLTAYDANGEVLGYKDVSHLFSPRTVKLCGKCAIAVHFGIPTILWYVRESRNKPVKITAEMSVDELYIAREYRKTDSGWEIAARIEED